MILIESCNTIVKLCNGYHAALVSNILILFQIAQVLGKFSYASKVADIIISSHPK